MTDLVDVERVPVEFRRRVKILPDRMAVGAVGVFVDDQAIERVERADEADDLCGGDDVALAGARVPVEDVAFSFLRRTDAGRDEDREQSRGERSRVRPIDHRPSARNDACATVHRASSSGSGSWAMPGTRDVATAPGPASTSSGLPRSLS